MMESMYDNAAPETGVYHYTHGYRKTRAMVLRWLRGLFGDYPFDLKDYFEYYAFKTPRRLNMDEQHALDTLGGGDHDGDVDSDEMLSLMGTSLKFAIYDQWTLSDGQLDYRLRAPDRKSKRYHPGIDVIFSLEVSTEASDIYSQRIGQGASGDVYACSASFEGALGSPRDFNKIPVAIKVPKPDWIRSGLESEVHILGRLKEVQHPNFTDLMCVFESKGRIADVTGEHFNLVFPRGLGNLRQLLNGQLCTQELNTPDGIDSLWHQFSGLADAVASLHDHRIGHNDIQAANVLLYADSDQGGLVCKLSGFEVATSLDVAETRLFGEEYEISSRDVMFANDVWRLGCVFSELLTFLLLGSRGVSRYEAYRTVKTAGFQSFSFDDLRFDRDGRTEPYVTEWIDALPRRDHRVAELRNVIQRMLVEEHLRLSGRMVTEQLAKSSLCLYTDGVRQLIFTEWWSPLDRSASDNLKIGIESYLKQPVIWWPLREPTRPVPKGSTRITWKASQSLLYMDIEQQAAAEYRQSCRPVYARPPGQGRASQNAANPPFPNTSSSTSVPATSYQPYRRPRRQVQRAPVPGNAAGGAVQSSVINAGEGEIYFCIDRAWKQPEETLYKGLIYTKNVTDDELGRALMAKYHDVRGWRGYLFSWKNCFGIDFIEFGCTARGQDRIRQLSKENTHELPPSGGNDWIYHLSATTDDIHCAFAAAEIVRSMHNPGDTHQMQTHWDGIPKKQNTSLRRDPRENAWGIRAKQGWSNFRFMCWMAGLMMLGLIFMICWLVLVDSKDLQSAMVGAIWIPTFLAVVLGYAQNKTKI